MSGVGFLPPPEPDSTVGTPGAPFAVDAPVRATPDGGAAGVAGDAATTAVGGEPSQPMAFF